MSVYYENLVTLPPASETVPSTVAKKRRPLVGKGSIGSAFIGDSGRFLSKSAKSAANKAKDTAHVASEKTKDACHTHDINGKSQRAVAKTIYFLIVQTKSDWYVARAENVVHLKCEHLSSFFLKICPEVVVLVVRKKEGILFLLLYCVASCS